MSFFKDVVAVFKKRELKLLESFKESGADDVYSLIFEKQSDLTWKAGQYGLFSITHKKIKNGTRPFSIASAPAENVIRITTRISDKPSEFKQALLELKLGMTIKMSGPVGAFSLEDNDPALLIAGGIGITPFRSILKQMEADGYGKERIIHLLYLDSNKSYLYRNELNEIANTTSIRVTYLDSKDDLHLELDQFTGANSNNGKYYIAGPKSMVESISSYLLTKNPNLKRNIKKDIFAGY